MRRLGSGHCTAGLTIELVGKHIRAEFSQLSISLFGFADVAVRKLRFAEIKPARANLSSRFVTVLYRSMADL